MKRGRRGAGRRFWLRRKPPDETDRSPGRRAATSIAPSACLLSSNAGFAGSTVSRFNAGTSNAFLGLERFKRTRVEWLKQDFREFFPHQDVFWITGKNNSLGSVNVSRLPLTDALPTGTMSTAMRVATTKSSRLGLFEMWAEPNKGLNDTFGGLVPSFADRANFDERLLASYLALLAQGQTSPQKLPPMKDGYEG